MIIFSSKAFQYLKCELFSSPLYETGGIFLGIYTKSKWIIYDTLFPGPNAVHKSASFKCDYEYVNYQANKMASLYAAELSVLGMWHSHIISSPLSLQDIATIRDFAALNEFGTISLLVDIEKSDYTFYIIRPTGEYIVERSILIKKEVPILGNTMIPFSLF